MEQKNHIIIAENKLHKNIKINFLFIAKNTTKDYTHFVYFIVHFSCIKKTA